MTHETEPCSSVENTYLFGARLQNAREAMGLDRKQAAAKLRLAERVIMMLENENAPSTIPPIFYRGYIRAYGKLLNVPDNEIAQALPPLENRPVEAMADPSARVPTAFTANGNYFMKFFTYLVIFTVVGLVGVWWYSHSNATPPTVATAEAALPLPAPVAIAPIPATVAQIAAPVAPPAADKKIVQAYANSSDTDDSSDTNSNKDSDDDSTDNNNDNNDN